MSNLNLQKFREWVWPWPWTFNPAQVFGWVPLIGGANSIHGLCGEIESDAFKKEKSGL